MRKYAILALALVSFAAATPPPNGQYDVFDILGYGKEGPDSGSVTGSNGQNLFVGTYTVGNVTNGFIYDHDTRLTTILGPKRPKRMRSNGSWVGTDLSNPSSAVPITGVGSLTSALTLPSGATQAWAEDENGLGTVVGSALVGGALTGVVWTNGTPAYLPIPQQFTGAQALRVSESGRIFGEVTNAGCIDMAVWTFVSGAWTVVHANCDTFGYNYFRFRDITTDDFALGQLAAGAGNPLLGKYHPTSSFSPISVQASPNNYAAEGEAGVFLQQSAPTGYSWTLMRRTFPPNSNWSIQVMQRPNGLIPYAPPGVVAAFNVDVHPFWGPQSSSGSLAEANGAFMVQGSQQDSVIYGKASFGIGSFSRQRPAIWLPDDNRTFVSGLIKFDSWTTLDTGMQLRYRWRPTSAPASISASAPGLIYRIDNDPQGNAQYRYAVSVPTGTTPVDIELSLKCVRAIGHENTWLSNVKSSIASPNQNANFEGTYRLKGGDIDANGVIDIADYSHLALHFDKTSTDADWFVKYQGVSPVMCDIDGNGTVDVADYSTIAINFDEVEVKF